MSVIVNTDYESVLFENKPSLKMKRELEFLGLWLNERVQNVMDYDDAYLEHIAHFTGRKPILVKNDPKARNWWGALKNIESERYLNSKETSSALAQALGEQVGHVIENEGDLAALDEGKVYLFKSFTGVSGKGHKFLSHLRESDFPLLAEEFHNRTLDFSTYCFENGECIYYQNFISPTFGYKGSLFDFKNSSSLLELDFVKGHENLDWKNYQWQVSKIIEFVREEGPGGFSIDSYVFDNKIRALCEINYRRTMGVTAFEIAKVISPKRFQLFLIFKTEIKYSELLELSIKKDFILLSHDRNFFSYLILSADTKNELKVKLHDLQSTIGTLSVEIQ